MSKSLRHLLPLFHFHFLLPQVQCFHLYTFFFVPACNANTQMVISIYKYINRQIPFAVSLSLSLFSFLNAPFHICEGKRGRRLCMWSISHVGMGLFSLFSFFLFFSLIIHHILPSMHLSFCFLYCYMIHFALSATNSALVRYFFFFSFSFSSFKEFFVYILSRFCGWEPRHSSPALMPHFSSSPNL